MITSKLLPQTLHVRPCTHSVPIFDHCDVVWSSCNKADMESLESLQRRASKIIVKSKCGTTSTDYLKLQSLEDRRNAHILGLVKRFLNNNEPQF